MPARESGRDYFRAYGARRKSEVEFLVNAIAASGGRCLWHSDPNRVPVYMTIDEGQGALVGALVYPFSAGHQEIKNRPADEHRLQVKYGDITEKFRREDHSLGFDPAGIDVTLVLGVHQGANLLIGLDPLLYDPLPMGIQIGFKDEEVKSALRSGWHTWERQTASGTRRGPRSQGGLETLIAFAPDRLIDYIALERHAQSMQLDPPLRMKAAESAAGTRASVGLHDLEREYQLSAAEILEIVSERSRLAMALRGGVAEHHLGRQLNKNRSVKTAEVGHREGPPDYWVTMKDGTEITIECKNASPKPYADGHAKAETQKTRKSGGDRKGRLYERDAFDVLAVCLYGPTGKWDFRYRRTKDLEAHPDYPDRLYQFQRIDDTWAKRLDDVV